MPQNSLGFFNPYLPLWLKELGFPILVISLLTSMQSFTVMGYGLGGTLGVLAGGAFASLFGFEAMFAVAAALGGLATFCSWRVWCIEHPHDAPAAA